jgi:hypothetical protein
VLDLRDELTDRQVVPASGCEATRFAVDWAPPEF